jgi:uncharacterized protein (DUF1919 family)
MKYTGCSAMDCTARLFNVYHPKSITILDMINTISRVYTNRVTPHIKRLRQYLLRRQWAGIKYNDFSIISSNCIGSRIYMELHISYRTPTVGLFFFPHDYIKFALDLPYYFAQPLLFTETSAHESANEARKTRPYPIGIVDDIEVHFLHYASRQEALEKWQRRKKRVNWERLFFTFTDQDCTLEDLENFDRLPYPNKVCFVAGKYSQLKSCVTVPVFTGQDQVGNLFTNYHIFLGVFDFTKWINQGAKTTIDIID